MRRRRGTWRGWFADRWEDRAPFEGVSTAELETVRGWFVGRLPGEWFVGEPELIIDRDEILIVGALSDVELEKDASDDARTAARSARIDRFREETRDQRVRIAAEAQQRFGRIVSWGAESGGARKLFTTAGVPVMTRLRLPDRAVLDTLMDAGIARTRSEALAWCVRLVSRNQGEWLQELRDAFTQVEKVRNSGPDAS